MRPSESLSLDGDRVLARLVTSFATQAEEIERFVKLCVNCRSSDAMLGCIRQAVSLGRGYA